MASKRRGRKMRKSLTLVHFCNNFCIIYLWLLLLSTELFIQWATIYLTRCTQLHPLQHPLTLYSGHLSTFYSLYHVSLSLVHFYDDHVIAAAANLHNNGNSHPTFANLNRLIETHYIITSQTTVCLFALELPIPFYYCYYGMTSVLLTTMINNKRMLFYETILWPLFSASSWLKSV